MNFKREGHLQEHDRIISLNNHEFDSSTTRKFISQILDDPTNRSIVICVLRNRRHLYHGSPPSPSFAPAPAVSNFTNPSNQSLPDSPIKANEVSPSQQRSTQRRLPSPVRVENLNRFSPQSTPTNSPSQPHEERRPLVRRVSQDPVDMVVSNCLILSNNYIIYLMFKFIFN